MSQSPERSIRRHPDGSIDIKYYGSQANTLRTAARTRALQRLSAGLVDCLAKLPDWMGWMLKAR